VMGPERRQYDVGEQPVSGGDDQRDRRGAAQSGTLRECRRMRDVSSVSHGAALVNSRREVSTVYRKQCAE
jgi:hypothetical protein